MRLQLKELKLRNYRNYKDLGLEVHPFLNILVGNNAQGKTNILESIYYLSVGKSHRTNKDQEIVNWESQDFFIKGIIETKNNNLNLEIAYQNGTKKQIKINGIDKRKIGNLLGNFNVVIFSPEDLYLVKGSPTGRRKFLDEEISQVNPQYYHYLNQYFKVLVQRNELLKNIRSNKQSTETLEMWDYQLAKFGALVTIKRIEVLKKLNPLARLMHRKITNGNENLEIKYCSSVEFKNNEKDDEIEEKILKQCQLTRKEDICRGITSMGPHRDDLNFFINDKEVKAFGSQGQQRTTVLALKLAELEYMKSERGEYPVLLLDDVMSELDEKRRIYLLEAIKDKIQTFVTTTNLHYFEEKIDKQGQIFKVEGGQINK